jgi:hypothetical protein
LSHALVTYIEEEGTDANSSAMELLRRFVKWNINNANWGYYTGLTQVNTAPSGSSVTFADPQAWWAYKMNDRTALDDIRSFIPDSYVNMLTWQGDFIGRVSAWVFETMP